MTVTNKLGNSTLNKYWNVFYFYFKDVSVQMCNKYKDFYLSIDGVPHVFKTDDEVIDFVNSLSNNN
jgi:hypothetical protein